MRTPVLLRAALVLVGVGLLVPGPAWAWGPATHLELSARVLENLALLPVGVRALLGDYPLDFYYGSIAADIVVGKRFTHYLRHCHRWVIGLEVLGNAASPSQRAFGLGYLSHLAADVVAHNYFVPYKTILSFPAKAMNHAYWEVRFDTEAPREVWNIPPRISRKMHLDNDELLQKVLSRSLLSFQTNKVIFLSVVLMGRFRRWHDLIHQTLEKSHVPLEPARVERYKSLSLDAVLGFLIDREEAWCFRADPTGLESLKAAAIIRGHLRRQYRSGHLSRTSFQATLERYRPHLEASVYAEPDAYELVEAAFPVTDQREGLPVR